MFAITLTLIMFFSAILAIAIVGGLGMLYNKLVRAPRSQECLPASASIVSSLSLGLIERCIGSANPYQPARRNTAFRVPTINASHVVSLHHPAQLFVDTVHSDPFADVTSFDPLGGDAEFANFRLPTDGPSKEYLRALGFQVRKTEASGTAPTSSQPTTHAMPSIDISSALIEAEVEEMDLTEADAFRQDPNSEFHSVMSYMIKTHHPDSPIKRIEGEISEEADFLNYQPPSCKALAQPTIVNHDDPLAEEDITVYFGSPVFDHLASPTLAPQASAEPALAPFARHAPPSPTSLKSALIAFADDDGSPPGDSSDDGRSVYSESVCDSDSSSASTTTTAASSPDPSSPICLPISSPSSIAPSDQPRIVISNSMSMHSLTSMARLTDYRTTLDTSSHICASDLCNSLFWRPISESADVDEVDPTLLSPSWAPDDNNGTNNVYDDETHNDDDKEDFAFIDDDDDDIHYHRHDSYNVDRYGAAHYYNSALHPTPRSRLSDPGALAPRHWGQGDDDVRLSDLDVEALEFHPEGDGDRDAYLLPSGGNESLSTTAPSIPIRASSSSCIAVELNLASEFRATSNTNSSFGIPLMRCPSRRGVYPRPLFLVARLSLP